MLAVSLVFSDVISITQERVMYGEDTRSAGWLWDLQNFYESPIVGKFPFLQPGEQPSGVERGE